MTKVAQSHDRTRSVLTWQVKEYSSENPFISYRVIFSFHCPSKEYLIVLRAYDSVSARTIDSEYRGFTALALV